MRIECMFEPFDAAIADHQHVETHATAAELRVLLEEERSGRGDAPLLAPANARRGTAETIARARAHLDDEQQIAGAGDDVDLADTTQVVAGDDREILRLEEGASAVLSGRTGL